MHDRRSGHRPTIFLGLSEIAGYYSALTKGFRTLGVPCYFVSLVRNPFDYTSGPVSAPIRCLQWLGHRARFASAGRPFHALMWLVLWLSLRALLTGPLFIWAVWRCDVFVFRSISSFCFFLDLPILKLCGKKIIYVFHGTDSRLPYISGVMTTDPATISPWKYVAIAKVQKLCIRIIEVFADVIVNHPAISHIHGRPIVNWLEVGIPSLPTTDTTDDAGPSEPDRSRPVRILHAPTRPKVKGSDVIANAVDRLKRRGHLVELVQIEGQPNQSVLQAIRDCDFVVDQVYSDTPMAGFSTEAAALGRSSVVGGNFCDHVDDVTSPDAIPPTVFCHPDHLEDAIERLIIDPSYRRELGRRAQDFVRSQWAAEQVASRYLRLFRGDIPDDWLFDPHQTRYLHGWGLHEDHVKESVRRVIEWGGRRALQLYDKPDLEQEFVDFAEIPPKAGT